MESRIKRTYTALRVAVVENFGLKVLSIVLALVLFGVVHGSGNVQRSLDVPLTFVLPVATIGSNTLLSAMPDKVRVTLRGTPSVLNSLRADDVGPLQVDLRDSHDRMVHLKPSQIVLPAGVSLVSFAPDSIPTQWDVLIERTLPLRASITGTLPPRGRVVHVEVDPPRVRVRGASLYVEPMATVHTDALDATGLGVGRFERRVPIESPRTGVEWDAHGARVTFEIVTDVYERRFERLPIAVLGGRATVRPPVVDIVVRGDPAVVDRLLPSQVVPIVDLGPTGTVRTTATASVDVRPLPEGATVGARYPEEVLVVPAR
jgi:hypothetical protein